MVINISGVPKMVSLITGPSDQTAVQELLLCVLEGTLTP